MLWLLLILATLVRLFRFVFTSLGCSGGSAVVQTRRDAGDPCRFGISTLLTLALTGTLVLASLAPPQSFVYSLLEGRKALPLGTAVPLAPDEIPTYVIDSAPVVFLYSEERYLPVDVRDFVGNMDMDLETLARAACGGNRDTSLSDIGPEVPSNPVEEAYERTSNMFLRARSDFSTDPAWIRGTPPNLTGRCDAPAILIVVDRGGGRVDAYWFFFYGLNRGPYVMGRGPFGDHVGDWEHTLVRFVDGVVESVWMSSHSGGGHYSWGAMEKMARENERGKAWVSPKTNTGKLCAPGPLAPVLYLARGTHANYPSPGRHSRAPYSVLNDYADRGTLWDPALNYVAYRFDGRTVTPGRHPDPPHGAPQPVGPTYSPCKHCRDAAGGALCPVLTRTCAACGGAALRSGQWLLFGGHWGDPTLARDDPRQRHSIFLPRYIDGPRGPLQKNLLRRTACQSVGVWGCRARKWLAYGEGHESRRALRVPEHCATEGLGGRELCGGVFNWLGYGYARWLALTIVHGGWVCAYLESR